MKEEWKRLIYHNEDLGDFYEISNFGELRNAKNQKKRSLNVSRTGYLFAGISLGSRNKKPLIKIHRAVAETFIPNPNNYPIINHIDGNKLNNNVCNLEWCTHCHNMQHAEQNNLINRRKGEDVPNSKLTYSIVNYIRNNYIPGNREFGARALAKRFNVCHSTIEDVIHNKTWI